jgi:hypothetical protein
VPSAAWKGRQNRSLYGSSVKRYVRACVTVAVAEGGPKVGSFRPAEKTIIVFWDSKWIHLFYFLRRGKQEQVSVLFYTVFLLTSTLDKGYE